MDGKIPRPVYLVLCICVSSQLLPFCWENLTLLPYRKRRKPRDATDPQAFFEMLSNESGLIIDCDSAGTVIRERQVGFARLWG